MDLHELECLMAATIMGQWIAPAGEGAWRDTYLAERAADAFRIVDAIREQQRARRSR